VLWWLELPTSCMLLLPCVKKGRRSGAVVARASHLMHAPPPLWEEEQCGSRRSEPPVAVSDLPLHELRILANHG
jgi:hypothetical protein